MPHYIELPDAKGKPQGLPACPECGEDGLSMIEPGEAFCVLCGAQVLDSRIFVKPEEE